MKYNNLKDIIQRGNIVIPLYIYKEYPKLKIDLESFLFLMFLYNKGNKIPFDINKLSEEFFSNTKDIMKYISILQDSKLIEIKVIKNDKNIMEEFIYLDFFYEKISLSLVSEEVERERQEEDNSDVFSMLEKEIGKQLSPIEIEIVKTWKESYYSDELIKEAIKEAVMNGAISLKYIDKILFTWAKKGIKTKEDVEQNRKNFNKKKEKEKVKDIKPNFFDDDKWLDEDE